MVCVLTSVFDSQNSEIQDSQLRMRINTKPNTQNMQNTPHITLQQNKRSNIYTLPA